MEFLNGAYTIGTTVPQTIHEYAPHRNIAAISVPDTKLANEARAIASRDLPPEIYNHSLRTFLFAQLIAKAQNHHQHDVEAVYVASILHDSGLSPKHMSSANRFEVDGALVAKELLRHHGIGADRAELVWDAITLHDSPLA
ncbi:MAG: HD domain-containing protein, partial [Candidatus Eremiobacteraeota bacterium]|nr:HD domain-containing protein [Candidatus Eremiobacteraeota bacterium]